MDRTFADATSVDPSTPPRRRLAADGSPFWLVTRYADVRAALVDSRLTVNRSYAAHAHGGFHLPRPLDGNLLGRDGADHARLRRFAAPAFAARRTKARHHQVEAATGRLLAGLAGRQAVDLVADFALPLPLTVVADLLGIPSSDRPTLTRWTQTMLTHTRHEELAASVDGVHHLLATLMTRYRHRGSGLVSHWARAREADNSVSDGELTALAFQVWWAGIENITHAISHGTLLLLAHPAQTQPLRDHPELLPAAVEEVLRLTTPTATATPRYAREDLTIAGVTVRAGDAVMLSLHTAHHDPHRFPTPQHFDPTRAPNHHLAFGHGPHHCLGASLARTQLRIAFTHLLRLPRLKLAVPERDLKWRTSLRLHAPQALPVTL
ncbi:cytochrome P450 [Streptomyces sp. NPDC093225]|uniref:cytochrome P450 n=1 Tax=Streptomyces sp. NPDC093225 TaxID=3366034 RepID=UPI0037F50127